ncbi:MAG: hypothetical protein R3E31_06470 [Chloroflexota bacterium]
MQPQEMATVGTSEEEGGSDGSGEMEPALRIITRTIYSLAGRQRPCASPATLTRRTTAVSTSTATMLRLRSAQALSSASAIQKDGSDPNESLLTDRGFTGQRKNGYIN